MANTRRNNSNTSAGFVYFNTNNVPYQNVNTSNFMAFNEPFGSPECNKFSPVHYSSPGKFQSPRNFHGRHSGRNNFRYHNNSGDNSSFSSSNRSFNSPGFSNSRNKSGHQHKKNNNSFNNGKKDISMYFDHTSLKDPWAELEEKLKRTQEAEAKQRPVIAEKETLDVEESSSSADEPESESETKTSSSELEDGTT